MADLRANGDDSKLVDDERTDTAYPKSCFEELSDRTPSFPSTDASQLGPSEKACQDARLSDSIKKAHSLHGAVAAKRQATTELLFFASVGDIGRIKTICSTWGIDVREPFYLLLFSMPQPRTSCFSVTFVAGDGREEDHSLACA
jgi:hypothetical protein